MGKKTPLFSIVVPIYNVEQYIEEMIQSVYAQDCDDWELILVDDGSTDRSGEICERYRTEEKVSIFHTKNNGAFGAAYFGVEKCIGKYIIVADGDDRLLSNCLSKVKKLVENQKYDMVVFGFKTFGKENDVEILPPLSTGAINEPKELVKKFIQNEYYAVWNKAIKTSLFKQNCNCDLGKVTMNNDIVTILPIAVHAKNAYIMNDVLYEYRIQGESLSHKLSRNKIIDAGRSFDFAKEILDKWDMLDDDIIESFCKTYSKPLLWIFELVANKKNDWHDFDEIRTQWIYKAHEKYERASFDGYKKAVLFKLYRKEKYRELNLLLWLRKKKGEYTRKR